MGSIATSRKCSVSVTSSIMIDSTRSHLDDCTVIWLSSAECRLKKIQTARSRTATSARHCSLLQNVIWNRAPHLFGDKLAFTVFHFIWWPQVHKQVKSWEPEQWELLLLGNPPPIITQTKSAHWWGPLKVDLVFENVIIPQTQQGYCKTDHHISLRQRITWNSVHLRLRTSLDQTASWEELHSRVCVRPHRTGRTNPDATVCFLNSLTSAPLFTAHDMPHLASPVWGGRLSTGSDFVTAAVAAESLRTDCVSYLFCCISSSTNCCIAGNWTGFSWLCSNMHIHTCIYWQRDQCCWGVIASASGRKCRQLGSLCKSYVSKQRDKKKKKCCRH